MKRIVVLLICLGTFAQMQSQQFPQYTNFVYNYLQYNPAVAGTAPCLDLKFGFRKQWTGIPDTPQTIFANAHGKIKGKKKKENRFHGVGATIETDKAGPFSYVSLSLLYSYHMPVSRKYTLASGVGVGFSQFNIDYSSMILEDQAAETVISGAVNDFVVPVVNFGFWLYSEKKFYGVSMRSIYSRPVDGVNGEGKLQTHWTFANGYAKKLSEDVNFKPAVLLNYVAQSKPSLEGQVMFDYKDVIALGVAARSGHGISGLFKLSVMRYVTLAYAFDLTANKMRYDGKNSHEIMIGIRACREPNPLHVPCAAYD